MLRLIKIKTKTIRLIFLIALCSTIFFINWFCSPQKKSIESKKTYASLIDSTQYVGMTQCRLCHESIYNTFLETGMGKSFDIVSKKKSSARFDEHALVYDKYKDFYYRPYWEGDSLKFMEFRLEGKDTVHKRIQTINYIVGSGQHTNSHIINTNNFLNQAPLTFYTQKGHWDLPPGFENGHNSRFNRLIGLECMTCHNGYPKFELGSENKFIEIKNGIDCERCHGPGSEHVKQKSAGIVVDTAKEIDYSIVNPSKLPINLQLDVCQRCHIQGNAVLNEGKSFFDFKPGMHLSEVMNVFMPVYKGSEEEHIMASHAERMKLSKCFIETMSRVEKQSTAHELALKPYKNALTCVTCHDPHVSRLVTDKKVFNSKCNNCHQAGKDHLCSEKESVQAKANFNCVQCHMPENGTTDIPHVNVHDHRIAVHKSLNEINKVKSFIGINCINNSNPSNQTKAKAFIAYYEKFGFDISVLDSALKYLDQKDLSKNFKSLVQVYYLKQDYDRVTKIAGDVNALSQLNKKTYDNNDAWTSYRIAESHNNVGDNKNALNYFENAYRLTPDYDEFANKYATALLMQKKNSEAKIVLEKLINEHPNYVQGLSNLGFYYLSNENNSQKAEALYNRAIALDPDYEQALLNKAGLLMATNRRQEAVTLLQKIVKKNPKNEKAKMILKQLST